MYLIINKKLLVLLLLLTSKINLAKQGDFLPTKEFRQCTDHANSNMTSLYLCIKKNNDYLERVIFYKLKKTNNYNIFSRWNQLKKKAKLQCRKSLTKFDGQEQELDDKDLNAPDYLALMYECIGNKYSDFNRYFLNERRRLYEK